MTDAGDREPPGEAQIIPLARPARRGATAGARTPAARTGTVQRSAERPTAPDEAGTPRPTDLPRLAERETAREDEATRSVAPRTSTGARKARPAGTTTGEPSTRAAKAGVTDAPGRLGAGPSGAQSETAAPPEAEKAARIRAGRATATRSPRRTTPARVVVTPTDGSTPEAPGTPAEPVAGNGVSLNGHGPAAPDGPVATAEQAPAGASKPRRAGAVRAGRAQLTEVPTGSDAVTAPGTAAGLPNQAPSAPRRTAAKKSAPNAPATADDAVAVAQAAAAATQAAESSSAANGLDRGAVPPDLGDLGPMAEPAGLERAIAGMLAFLRRRITGDYEVDELGFDADLTEHVIAPLLRPVYQNYFRVETRGLENVPDTGGALVVANHSGTLPIDALMVAMALLDHHPAHRNLRMLAADLVFSVPFLAPLARKTGNTLACQADAERLLGKGEMVGVWPEGFKGVGKPFSERYKLQRFGRGGFVSAALRTGVPIIPCTIVGAEEIYPMLGNARTVARLLGLPYFPLTPTFPWLGVLGMVPLPSKWLIEFGEPVETAHLTPAAAEDPMLVFELTDRIRETIQHTLYGLLMQRRSVFF